MEDTILNLHNRRKLESKHLRKQKFKDETKQLKLPCDHNLCFKVPQFNKRELTNSEKIYLEQEFQPNEFEKRILNIRK